LKRPAESVWLERLRAGAIDLNERSAEYFSELVVIKLGVIFIVNDNYVFIVFSIGGFV
jgi:hypothetical protein